ncbi:hypothetical protein FLBR109950_07860 [Flavobacterium branchiophilum]
MQSMMLQFHLIIVNKATITLYLLKNIRFKNVRIVFLQLFFKKNRIYRYKANLIEQLHIVSPYWCFLSKKR